MDWIGETPRMPEWDGVDRPPFVFPKRDGHQVTVIKHESGRVQALTRTPTDITEKIRHLLLPIHEGVPCGVALIGELWCPGRDHSTIKTAINERDPLLRWEAFAILGMVGWDPRDVAKISVPDVTQTLIAWGCPQIAYQRPHKGRDLLEQMQTAEAEFQDYEGFVGKRANLADWWKWKPVHTIDLVVSGFTNGEGKYSGLAGALECTTIEGYPVARCSGMDDDVRWSIDDSWIGRVVEVRYQSITSRGRLRHPRFVRVRDDKPAKDCDVWQQPRLVEYWHSAAGKKEMKR